LFVTLQSSYLTEFPSCVWVSLCICVCFFWPCLLPRQRYCVFRFIIE
jgi:hypothetical protein